MNIRAKWSRLAVLLAAGAVMAGSVGCSGKKTDEVKAIQEAGVLRVALADDQGIYGPMGDSPTGTEPELAQWIAQALGVTVQYQTGTRAEALASLDSGEADIALGSINASGELGEKYQISTPYEKGFFFAVTQRGDYVLTKGALKDSAVGMTRSLDQETKSRIYEAGAAGGGDYSSAEQAAKAIKDGTIRAYICYEKEAKELVADDGLQVQSLGNMEPEEYVIAAGAKSSTLINGINTLIRQYLEKE